MDLDQLETLYPELNTPDGPTLPCRLCGETLPVSAFYRASRSKTGYRGECKTCYSGMASVKAQNARKRVR